MLRLIGCGSDPKDAVQSRLTLNFSIYFCAAALQTMQLLPGLSSFGSPFKDLTFSDYTKCQTKYSKFQQAKFSVFL